jgi:hypothetical protein
MRCRILLLMLAGPVTAFGAPHTIGIDIGRASTADMRCPPAESGLCKLQDDAQRVFYEFRPGAALGFRATYLYLNDLRITTSSDPIFNLPGTSSEVKDVSVTYSYPVGEWVALAGRIGLAHWEESRSFGGFSRDTSNGLSPVLGLNVDFGGKRLRAGVSADIYPSLGDTGYVRYFGAGLRISFGRSRALGSERASRSF